MPKECRLQCPRCGAGFDFSAVSTIVPDSPELEALLAGQLNVAQCPQCGEKLNVPTPLIFRDSARPCLYALELERPSSGGELSAMALRLDEGATTAAQANGTSRPQVRLLFSRPDFIEKIALHQAGLDDRVVEFAKYQLFNGGANGEIDPARHRLLYDFGHSTDRQMVFIVFARKGGRPLRLLQVAMAEYQRLHDEISNNPQLQQELDHIFPGCLVDVDHVFEQLRTQKGEEP